MPTTCRPLAACARCSSDSIGISSTQGAHQVAQKFSSSGRPSNSPAERIRPDASRCAKSGRRWPSRSPGADGPTSAGAVTGADGGGARRIASR